MLDMSGFPGETVLNPCLKVSEAGILQSIGASNASVNQALSTEGYSGSVVEGRSRGLGALDLQFVRASAGNVASGQMSSIIGSLDSGSSGRSSAVIGGVNNSSSGNYSATLGGKVNTTPGTFAVALGGNRLTANKYGHIALGAGVISSTSGAAMHSLYQMANTTSDGTTTKLWLDGTGASQALTLTTNQALAFHIIIVAVTSQAADSAMFEIKGGIANNNGTVALVGTPTSVLIGNTAGAALWTAVAAADNTAKALLINVTGAAATNIRWVAAVQCAEVTF